MRSQSNDGHFIGADTNLRSHFLSLKSTKSSCIKERIYDVRNAVLIKIEKSRSESMEEGSTPVRSDVVIGLPMKSLRGAKLYGTFAFPLRK